MTITLSRRELLKAGGVLGASLLLPEWLAACAGGGGQPTGSIVFDEAKAKAEGEVTFYSMIGDAQPALLQGFQAKYPWAKVNTYAGTPADVQAKFLLESSQKQYLADVAMSTGSFYNTWKGINAMASDSLPNDSAIPNDLRAFAPELRPVYQVFYVIMYNTQAGIQPPTDPFELADPRWRNKIAMDKPTNLGASALVLANRRTVWADDAKWTTWLAGLKANNVLLTSGGNATYAAVLQGERPLGIAALQNVLNQKAGAPVAAQFYQDLASSALYMLRSNFSQHPHMGQLYINWLLSDEGQLAISSTGRTPITNVDTPKAQSKLIPSGIRVLPELKYTRWITNPAEYSQILGQFWPA